MSKDINGEDTIVKGAEKEAADIIAKAKSKAQRILEYAKVEGEIKRKIYHEYLKEIEDCYKKIQRYCLEKSQLTDEFKNNLNGLISSYLYNVSMLEDFEPLRMPYNPETATAPPTEADAPNYPDPMDIMNWVMSNTWLYYRAQK